MRRYIAGILKADYPADEFYIGGVLVREVISNDQYTELKNKGVHLHRMAASALNAVSKQACGTGFLQEVEASPQ